MHRHDTDVFDESLGYWKEKVPLNWWAMNITEVAHFSFELRRLV
jgi:hypothetical protein